MAAKGLTGLKGLRGALEALREVSVLGVAGLVGVLVRLRRTGVVGVVGVTGVTGVTALLGIVDDPWRPVRPVRPGGLQVLWCAAQPARWQCRSQNQTFLHRVHRCRRKDAGGVSEGNGGKYVDRPAPGTENEIPKQEGDTWKEGRSPRFT